MNINIKSALVVLLLLNTSWVGFYFLGKSDCQQPTPSLLIPTRGDIQQRLVDEGYGIGPKGVDCYIGDDSNTGWEQYEIDTFKERLEQ